MGRSAAIPCLVLLVACAQPPPARPEPVATAGRMEWWQQARFGVFVHWGLYSVLAGTWRGQGGYGEWIRDTARIPRDEYAALADRFTAERFDADAWARTIAAAGAGYVVFTAKHHDGFCLFASSHGDFDVMRTPLQRDAVAELAAACRRHGLRFGLYYSIMDWHHPDYLPRRSWEQDRPTADARQARYVDHVQRQVAELLGRYGPVDVLWFDGEWEHSWTQHDGEALYRLCRRLQPATLVNNRVAPGPTRAEDLLLATTMVGDFATPEQAAPAGPLPHPWELCLTMNDHWGYSETDRAWKPAGELVRTLVDAASKGGNLLLNVGPTGDGRIPDACRDRLEAIGRWLATHGEAVRGTRASPWGDLPWGRSTWRPDGDDALVYLHVFDWPADGVLVVPGLANEVVDAALLGEPPQPCAVLPAADGFRLRLPARAPEPIPAVVRMRVRGTPTALRAPRILAPARLLVQPMTVRLEPPGPDCDVHYTLDGSEPDAAAPRYRGPFAVAATTTLRARTFFRGRPVGEAARAEFRRVEPAPAATPTDTLPGLRRATFRGAFQECAAFLGRTPDREDLASGIDLGSAPAEENVARVLDGYLMVPDDGVWTFALIADDGARLWLDDVLVVDNDGLHPPRERRGDAALARGLHRFRLAHFNAGGGAVLRLLWAPAGEPLQPVPGSALVH